MSWFSDIAGKAEALLNQVDQVAATSLQEVGIGTPSPKKPQSTTFHQDSCDPPISGLNYEPVATVSPIQKKPIGSFDLRSSKHTLTTENKSTPTISKHVHGNESTWSHSFSSSDSYQESRSQSALSKHMNNESLLEFLNSPPAKEKTKRDGIRITKTTPTIPRIRQEKDKQKQIQSSDKDSKQWETGLGIDNESKSTLAPVDTIKTVEQKSDEQHLDIKLIDYDFSSSPLLLEKKSDKQIPMSHSHDEIRSHPHFHDEIGSHPHSHDKESLHLDSKDLVPQSHTVISSQPGVIQVEEPLSNIESDKSPSDVRISETPQDQTSNLELENHLLRQEVGSLSKELSDIISKSRESTTVESHLRKEVHSLRQQCSQFEGLLRHMRSQEDDLTSALEARDSQIHVLRVRLEECDQTIDTMRKKVEDGEKEKERLLRDAGLSSVAQNNALDSVKIELQNTQSVLISEREAHAAMKNELSERENQFIAEKEELSDALYAQQRELQQHHIQYSDCHKKLQTALNELQLLKKEYEEYKTKATNILQSKEHQISALQSPESSGKHSVLETALEEARIEKQQLLSQIHTTQQQIQYLKEQIQDTEDNHSIEMEQLLEQLKVNEDSLEEEKTRHLNTQDDLNKLQQELNEVKDDYVREKSVMAAQLREKDNEIHTLTSKIATGSDQSDVGKKELEGRLQELTESLIQKQTEMEILSSERNSLHHQLERTKASLVQAQSKLTNKHTALVIDGDTTETGSNQLRPMASILPSSSDTTPQRHLHKVKRSLDQIDKLSVRLGWVFRRYPYFRLLTFGYMVLLHLWVIVVLLTYKPEIHTGHPEML